MDELKRKEVWFAYKVILRSESFLSCHWENSKTLRNELDSSRIGWWNAGTKEEHFKLKTRGPLLASLLSSFSFSQICLQVSNPSTIPILMVIAFLQASYLPAAIKQYPNWSSCHQPAFPPLSTLHHTQEIFLEHIVDHVTLLLKNPAVSASLSYLK